MSSKDVFENYNPCWSPVEVSDGWSSVSSFTFSFSPFEEKQQKLQLELRDFSRSVPCDLNSSNIAAVEELQCKEQLYDEKIRLLEDQLSKSKAEEKAQRLKCLFLTKQMKKLSSKTK